MQRALLIVLGVLTAVILLMPLGAWMKGGLLVGFGILATVLLLAPLGGWAKRALFIALGVFVAMIVLVPLGAWWYVFHTEAGTRLVLWQLDRLPNIRITLQDVKGKLGGTLKIARLELDEAHVHIVAENIELHPRPSGLLAQTLRIDFLAVGSTLVTLKRTETPPTARPPRFMPNFLRLSVGQTDIRNIEVITQSGGHIAADRVRGQLGINTQNLRVEKAQVEAPAFGAQGDFTLVAAKPLRLETRGQLSARVGEVEYSGTADVSGTIEELLGTVELAAPSVATAQVTLKNSGGWRLTGTVQSELFALTPWVEKPPFSVRAIHLAIDARLDGTPEAMHVSGDVTLPEIDPLPLRIDAYGNFRERALDIARVAIVPHRSDTEVTAALRIQLGGERPLLDGRAQWRQFRWPLHGAAAFVSPSGHATLKGDMPYAIDVQGNVQLPAGLMAQATARGSLSKEAIDVKDYALVTLEGNATGSARLAFGTPRAWRFTSVGRGMNPRAFSSKFPGRLNFDVAAQGVGFDAEAPFTLELRSLNGVLRTERVEASGEISRDATSLKAKQFKATMGTSRLLVDGVWSERSDLSWDIEIPAIERLVDSASGSLVTHGALAGTRAQPRVAGVINGSNLRYADFEARTVAVRAVIHAGGESTVDAQIDAMRRGNLQLERLEIAARGATEAHKLSVKVTLPVEKSQAIVGGSLAASGSYRRGEWLGTIDPLRLSDAEHGEPTAQAAAANARISPERIQLDNLCSLWTDRRLCGSGSWSNTGAWHAKLESDPLSLAMFDGFLPGRLQGHWQVSADFQAEAGRPWSGSGVVQFGEANIAYQPIEGAEEIVQLGNGRVDLDANAQRVAAQLKMATPGTTSIEGRAEVTRTAAEFAASPLSARLDLRTEDANLLPLLLPDLDHAAGALRLSLQASGSLAAPRVQGAIDLTRGELALYRFNLMLRDMTLGARIVDNTVDFNLRANAGEGLLNLSGNIAWRDGAPHGRVQVRGDDLLVADVPDYRVVASPNVEFAINGDRIDATGEVFIPRAQIQPADLRTAVQRSPDARLVNMTPQQSRGGFFVHSEVRVRLGDEVRLKTYGLQGTLGGAVTTYTAPGETPRGRGELSVSNGHYEAYGQELDIDRGRLLFDASPLDNPGLDILAVRSIEEQRVGVNVRGTLRAPRLSWFSDPSLPQAQIISYLLTGKPLDDLSVSESTAVGSATDALAVQGGSLLASQIGRRIGLEEVSVESNNLNETSLVLGKFLSPRLFVSYGISLTESINTLKIRYTLSERWLFKSEAGQEQSADIEFRIER